MSAGVVIVVDLLVNVAVILSGNIEMFSSNRGISDLHPRLHF